jgi:hypothetical protein
MDPYGIFIWVYGECIIDVLIRHYLVIFERLEFDILQYTTLIATDLAKDLELRFTKPLAKLLMEMRKSLRSFGHNMKRLQM